MSIQCTQCSHYKTLHEEIQSQYEDFQLSSAELEKELMVEVETKTREAQEAQSALHRLVDKLDQTNAEVKQIRSRSASQQEESLRTQETQQEQLLSYQADRRKMEQNLSQLTSKMRVMEAELQDAQGELEGAQEELEFVKTEMADLDIFVKKLQEQLADLKSKKDAAKKKKQQKKELEQRKTEEGEIGRERFMSESFISLAEEDAMLAEMTQEVHEMVAEASARRSILSNLNHLKE